MSNVKIPTKASSFKLSLESLHKNKQASFPSQTLRDTEKSRFSWGLLERGEQHSQLGVSRCHLRTLTLNPQTFRVSSLTSCCLWAPSCTSSSNLHPVGEESPLPCPLVICSAFLFQRATAKATSQCSVGWRSCLAIVPSQATTNSAASPVACETTSPTRTMGQSHQLGSTTTLMCSCLRSQGQP